MSGPELVFLSGPGSVSLSGPGSVFLLGSESVSLSGAESVSLSGPKFSGLGSQLSAVLVLLSPALVSPQSTAPPGYRFSSSLGLQPLTSVGPQPPASVYKQSAPSVLHAKPASHHTWIAVLSLSPQLPNHSLAARVLPWKTLSMHLGNHLGNHLPSFLGPNLPLPSDP